ncbi:MAG: hypothetical protein CMH56_01195 [Myxococcales bacterium]|nr:hypothetical protein [Myxococcales bacterium]
MMCVSTYRCSHIANKGWFMNRQFGLTLLYISIFITALPNCSCDVEVYSPPSPALIVVMPDEIDFGAVAVDSFASRTFTILNEGKATLSVSALTLDPLEAPFAPERNTYTIEGESSVDAIIHFRPTEDDSYEAILTVSHDASNNNEPKTVTLKGRGASDLVCTSCDGLESECQEDTLVSYENIGGCEEDQCLYQSTETWCACGCDAQALECILCPDAGPTEVWDAGSFVTVGEVDAGLAPNLVIDAGSGPTAALDAGISEPVSPESESYRAVIAANIERTCGINASGEVKCWGKCDLAPSCPPDGMWGNNAGEAPADMPALNLGFNTPVASIKWSGFAYCVLTTNNYAKCWGNNMGSLGFPSDETVVGADPAQMGANLPYLDVGAGLTIQKLDLAFNHGCALLTNGKVKCWGAKSFLGLGLSGGLSDQLGDEPGEMGDALPFLDFGSHGHEVVDIALAGENSCALFSNGKVKCWGRNSAGQLGIGEPPYVLGLANTRGDAPDEMGDNLPFVDLGEDVFAIQVTLGIGHACVLTFDQRVKCWGANNEWGFLGQGHDLPKIGTELSEMGDNLPYTDLGSQGGVLALFAKGTHTCALFDIGKIKCWGDNWTGMLGYEDVNPRGSAAAEMGDNLPFVDLGTDFFAMGLTVGALSTCVSSMTDEIKCWGTNPNGELGLGDTANRGDNYGEMGDNLPVINID